MMTKRCFTFDQGGGTIFPQSYYFIFFFKTQLNNKCLFLFQEEDALDGESAPHSISLPSITHHSIMYAPKCLVLVSRLDYIETFRVSFYLFIF